MAEVPGTDGSQEEELRRLRVRVANLERFASRLAHELSTPLTTARGFANLLLQSGNIDEEVRDGLERVQRAAARAEAVLHHRLDETLGEQPRAVRLRALLRDGTLARLPGAHDAARLVDDEVSVFGDPVSLHRVVSLLVEAVEEHAAAHEVDPAVASLELVVEEEDAVTVRFLLPAPPLAAADRRRALAFERDDVAQEHDVVSLLAVARRTAAGLGGRVWLDDPASSEDRFTLLVQFPRAVTSEGWGAVSAT